MTSRPYRRNTSILVIALRTPSAWAAFVAGIVLVALTVTRPAVAWTLLLWMIAAGVAVGEVRGRRADRQSITQHD